MNTTDAEIAGKLDGMECGGVQVIENTANNDVWVSVEALHVTDDAVVHFTPSDLLAFCRAVVERVDGEPIVMNTSRYAPAPRAFFSVEETAAYLEEHLDLQLNIRNKNLEEAIRFIKNELCGLAATTERNRRTHERA